jgi:hypothetical protein
MQSPKFKTKKDVLYFDQALSTVVKLLMRALEANWLLTILREILTLEATFFQGKNIAISRAFSIILKGY